jgi:hypothetical protein
VIVGYQPERIARLGRLTRSALDGLGELTSDDPAATDAVAAVARMRRTLTSELLSAVAAIEATDPLSRASRATTLGATIGGTSWYRDWLRASIQTPYSSMSDDELLSEFEQREAHVPHDSDFGPDMADRFWDGFEHLAIELSVRVSADERFADRVVARAADSFLIPFATRYARFDPDVVGRMLVEVSTSRSAVVDALSNYQAAGADALLDVLSRHPHESLAVLDLGVLEELIEWRALDGRTLGAFLEAAMAVPFTDRTRLHDAFAVLQDFVALANRRLHETGFPEAVSPTIAQILVQYLPFFITSLDGYSDVHLKGFDFRDAGMQLGTFPEVLDLFGAVMRDPASLDIVLASIPGVAIIGAGDNGPLGITPDDVADYVDTIGKAAVNEQLEEQLEASRSERNALWATEIAFRALEFAVDTTGPALIAGVAVSIALLEQGTKSVVEWAVDETDLGLQRVGVVAFLLVAFGLGVGVLRSRRVESDDAGTDGSELAEEILDTMESRIEGGATVDELGGLIDDFRRTVRPLDQHGIMDILDDPRILPPDIGTRTQLDVQGGEGDGEEGRAEGTS